MKKQFLILLVFLLLALIALSIYLCIEFFGLYQQTNEPTPSTAASTAPISDIASFVQEAWRIERAEYDEATQCLTLYKSYDLSYAQACKVGGSIFTDDLAPQSYLQQTLTIAADITTRFDCPKLVVVMNYLSNDEQVIFSVDSNGGIDTCWTPEK